MIIKKALHLIIDSIRKEVFYYRNKTKINKSLFGVNILSIDETIQFMKRRGHSIVRFGDGEFMLMNGQGITHYQKYNSQLQKRLKDVFNSKNDKMLVCLPEPMIGIAAYRHKSQVHWTYRLLHDEAIYHGVIQRGKSYGNSFVSRPYMIYRDKEQSAKWFKAIKALFYGKNIVIIEGEYSRTGVGNDLFADAKSVKRILCPSINAYDAYDLILKEALKLKNDNVLIVIALGPTGKILTQDLVQHGYWVYDLGHIDSEYEWYRAKASTKSKVKNKHTADTADGIIGECKDQAYLKSIIARISD